MTVNQRIEELVNKYSEGNVSQFAKMIGVSHTSIASMLPGGRESKPGYEILAKITDAIPAISSDWLLKGKGDMLVKGEQPGNASNNMTGNNNTGNQWTGSKKMRLSTGNSSEAELMIVQMENESMKRDADRQEKYIARLERDVERLEKERDELKAELKALKA